MRFVSTVDIKMCKRNGIGQIQTGFRRGGGVSGSKQSILDEGPTQRLLLIYVRQRRLFQNRFLNLDFAQCSLLYLAVSQHGLEF
jgi:hypothetical protein